MREGVEFVRRDSLLQAVIVLFVAINLLEDALVAVLLPTFAVGMNGGAAALGVPIAALGAGAFLGSVIHGRFGKRLLLSATLFWSLMLSGPPKYLALAFAAPLPGIAVAFFVAGLVAGPVNPMLSAVQLRRIPAPLRGRVLGAIMCGVVATIPLAVLIAGWLAEQVPLTGVLFGGAVIYALTAVVGAATPPLRHHSSPQANGM